MLINIYSNIDVFMVVFVRVVGFFVILPIMSGLNVPMQSRLALALGFALIAFMSNSITLPPYGFNIVSFALLLMQEFMVGLILGLVVMMIFSMFHFVGQLVDFQVGYKIANAMDPFSNQQTPLTGNMYYMLVSLFFITQGGLHLVLQAMFDSFGVLHLGEAVVLTNQNLTMIVINIIIGYFRMGLNIALPIVGTLIIVNVILGILVKAVPQMNVFVVGMPLKVLLGLFLIVFSMPVLISAFEWIMNDIYTNIVMMIREMIP
jgi:flagellar biosynthetic protein FliR